MIVVRMGVENISDFESEVLDACLELTRVVSWINHRTQAALFIANQVAKITIASGIDLFKNHALLLHTDPLSDCEAPSWSLSAMRSFRMDSLYGSIPSRQRRV